MTIIYAEQLNVATDDLVQGTRVKVYRDATGIPDWATMPSLLEQLADVAKVNNGASSGKPESKPTINAGIVGLLLEIPRVCIRQLVDTSRRSAVDRLRGASTPQLLRGAAKATNGTSDPEEMAAWLTQLVNWKQSARKELHLDDSRRQWLRGIPCQHCKAVNAWHTDQAGAQVKTPALAVRWRAPEENEHDAELWRVACIECLACGVRDEREA